MFLETEFKLPRFVMRGIHAVAFFVLLLADAPLANAQNVPPCSSDVQASNRHFGAGEGGIVRSADGQFIVFIHPKIGTEGIFPGTLPKGGMAEVTQSQVEVAGACLQRYRVDITPADPQVSVDGYRIGATTKEGAFNDQDRPLVFISGTVQNGLTGAIITNEFEPSYETGHFAARSDMIVRGPNSPQILFVDGVLVEASGDPDGDGVPTNHEVRSIGTNYTDSDSNDDGIADGLMDTDGDGEVDSVDVFALDAAYKATDDLDGDGMPSQFDPDDDNDGIPDKQDPVQATRTPTPTVTATADNTSTPTQTTVAERTPTPTVTAVDTVQPESTPTSTATVTVLPTAPTGQPQAFLPIAQR